MKKNSEPHTGARPSVRLCVGPELARCVHYSWQTLYYMYVHTRQAPLNSHADRAMQLNTNFLVLSQLQKHIPAHHKQVPCESQKTNATGPFRFRRAQLNGDLSLGASITLLMVLASSTCGDRIHVIATLCRPLPHQDWGRAGSAGNRFARDDKERGSQLGETITRSAAS